MAFLWVGLALASIVGMMVSGITVLNWVLRRRGGPPDR
jgi:hypothetical protein